MRDLIEDLEGHIGGEPGDIAEELQADDVFWKVVDRKRHIALRRQLGADKGGNVMLRAILVNLIGKVTPKGNDGVALMKLQSLLHDSGKLNGSMIRNQLEKIGDLLGIRGIGEGLDEAATASVGSVTVFLDVLSSKMTQYDVRASRKPGHNPNAIAHYLKALDKVREGMRDHLGDDTPEALSKMKKILHREFIVDSFSPAKNVIKQIDAFLKSGKLPRLRG